MSRLIATLATGTPKRVVQVHLVESFGRTKLYLGEYERNGPRAKAEYSPTTGAITVPADQIPALQDVLESARREATVGSCSDAAGTGSEGQSR